MPVTPTSSQVPRHCLLFLLLILFIVSFLTIDNHYNIFYVSKAGVGVNVREVVNQANIPSVRRFINVISEPVVLAFATTSSESALPVAMESQVILYL
jgi:Na+/H+-dicarboxylate symporter